MDLEKHSDISPLLLSVSVRVCVCVGIMQSLSVIAVYCQHWLQTCCGLYSHPSLAVSESVSVFIRVSVCVCVCVTVSLRVCVCAWVFLCAMRCTVCCCLCVHAWLNGFASTTNKKLITSFTDINCTLSTIGCLVTPNSSSRIIYISPCHALLMLMGWPDVCFHQALFCLYLLICPFHTRCVFLTLSLSAHARWTQACIYKVSRKMSPSHEREREREREVLSFVFWPSSLSTEQIYYSFFWHFCFCASNISAFWFISLWMPEPSGLLCRWLSRRRHQ